MRPLAGLLGLLALPDREGIPSSDSPVLYRAQVKQSP